MEVIFYGQIMKFKEFKPTEALKEALKEAHGRLEQKRICAPGSTLAGQTAGGA
jgi:hypothetical protein